MAEIDRQHKKLMTTINDLNEAATTGRGKVASAGEFKGAQRIDSLIALFAPLDFPLDGGADGVA